MRVIETILNGEYFVFVNFSSRDIATSLLLLTYFLEKFNFTKIIKCGCRNIHVLNENIRYIYVKLFTMNARSIVLLEVKKEKSLFEYYTESVESIHKEKYLPRIFHISIDFVISRFMSRISII